MENMTPKAFNWVLSIPIRYGPYLINMGYDALVGVSPTELNKAREVVELRKHMLMT